MNFKKIWVCAFNEKYELLAEFRRKSEVASVNAVCDVLQSVLQFPSMRRIVTQCEYLLKLQFLLSLKTSDIQN
jgi:hypothetical protein